ncbi:MAG: serine/threonine-protein kinase [Planctomycetota bacterium]
MTLGTCPTDQDLREYAIGNCGDDLYQNIEEHLRACPTCEDTIAQFDCVDDTLMRHLPLAVAGQIPTPAPAPLWLDRLRERVPQPSDNEFTAGTTPPTAIPQEGLANYELLGVLGRGGMGIVYLARHRQLNRRVALKVLSPHLLATPEAHYRFQREIQLLGRLNHPGIVMATDAGTVASGAYLVMELIDGADLSRVVREKGPLSVGEACEVGRQLAEALAAAHESGAIHRDVKPSNVMIDRQQGRVRLLDFGLARLEMSLVESGETSLGRLLGTLDYMAPEQSEGDQAVDFRADFYGLGATLYFLLTGRPPHGSHVGRSLLEHLRTIATTPAPRVRSLRLDIPEELDDFIARLLSHHLDQRPASARDVAQELSRWAGGDLAARAAEISPPPALLEQTSHGTAEAEQSLSELLGLTLSPAMRRESVPTVEWKTSVHSPRRRWPWLALLGAAAVVLVFGITILLDTPQGTLRIESEVDNVQVELVNDQKQVQELRIESGEAKKETKLRAGPYRITLSGKHDGLSIDKDIITLRRGDVTVARITRNSEKLKESSQKNSDVTTVAAPEQAAPKIPERLYQGKSESDWQLLFVAETEPVAKLVAADALMNLAAELPNGRDLDRILDVGQEIVQASFGSDAVLFAFEDPWDPPLRARRWPRRDGKIDTAYREFQTALNDRITQLSGEQLAERLSEAILKHPDPRAAFAYSLLNYAAKNPIRMNPAAVKVVIDRLNVPLTGVDRSAICLLARFQFVDEASAEDRQSMFTAMNDLVVRLQNTPPGQFPDRLTSGLRAVVDGSFNGQKRSNLPPILVKSLASMILRDVVEDRRDAMNCFPLWGGPLIPYDRSNTAQIRNRMSYFSNAWVAEANQYLEQHRQGPYSDADRDVVRSLEVVLPTYSEGDDWPVEKTAEIFAEQLRVTYAEPSDQALYERLPTTAAQLLTRIVHVTGQIPDFVRSGHPQTTSVTQKLSQLERLLAGKVEIGPNRIYGQFDELKGLLVSAPYETIRLSVGETPLPKNTQMILRGLQVPLNPIELLYVTSGSENDRNNRSEPPTDPLLLLVALADLTGVNEPQDERIATFFVDTPGNKIVLRGHLENVLSNQSKTREIVVRHLREMASKSKSQKLIDAIRIIEPASTPAN